VSVTEKEIFNGILRKSGINENNVLYFEREIEDIEEQIEKNPKLAGRFIDLKKDYQLDLAAKNLVQNLKKEKIPSCLAESNIFRFKVKWDNEVGVSFETHKEYIIEFGERFYEVVKQLIDRNVERERKVYSGSKYLVDESMWMEILDHARFCIEKVTQFHGRHDLLNLVRILETWSWSIKSISLAFCSI